MFEVVRKGFAQLLCDPKNGWMSGDMAVQDSPAIMRDDKEAIKDSKRKCRSGKEIHGRYGFTVVVQKS